MAQSIFSGDSRDGVRSQSFADSAALVHGYGDGNGQPDPNLSSQLCAIAQARYQVRQLLWKLIFATFLLMAIGSATRVMNAGLACPDWPLCYGTLIPTQQMNLQVFLEWIHRLDASLIGLMTIGLVVLSIWKRHLLPAWVLWGACLALFLVCLQGGLGALTVTALLRFDIVTAHLGTALSFFALLVVMAIALIPPTSPFLTQAQRTGDSLTVRSLPPLLPWIALGTTVLIYLQSLTGGLVGSRWALHQCLAIAHLCSVMNSHLWGVLPTSVSILALLIWAWRLRKTIDFLILRFLSAAGALLLLQICLGLATFHLHLEVELLTIAHQATGAALFGSLLCATVRGFSFLGFAIPQYQDSTI